MIGDSINDLQAAISNDIFFIPFNYLGKSIDYSKKLSEEWFLKNL